MMVHITDIDTFDYGEEVNFHFNWETHEYDRDTTKIRYGMGSLFIDKSDTSKAPENIDTCGLVLDEFKDGECEEVTDDIFCGVIEGAVLNRCFS